MYRVTKELVGIGPNQIPKYLRYLGNGIEEFLGEFGSDELSDLKSGRWHWRGTIHMDFDQWTGEYSEEWHSESLTRIR